MNPKPTAAELLETTVVLTATEVAYILRLTYHKGRKAGTPNRLLVLDLVDRGLLAPVDPTQPIHRWRFSTASIKRYLMAVAA
jgi:hypothetical protein